MKNLYILLVLFVTTISCSKESVIKNKNISYSINATIEQTENTKTSLGNEYSIEWTNSDQIKIFDGVNSTIYEYDASIGSWKHMDDVLLNEGPVYAYYPADMAKDYDSGIITAKLPGIQVYSQKSFGQGAAPMVAKGNVIGSTINLPFKNILSFIELKLHGNGTISSLKLTADSDLCGQASVNISGTTPSLEVTGANSICLDNIDVTLSNESESSIILGLPAKTYNTIAIVATMSESAGNMYRLKESTTPHTTQRNAILPFAKIDISSCYGIQVEPEANCYMVDANGASTMIIPSSQVVKGWRRINSDGDVTYDYTDIQSIIDNGNWEIIELWRTGNNKTEGSVGKAFSSNIIYGGICVNCPDGVNGSNTLLALKTTQDYNGITTIPAGTILWSWHIWYTDYKPSSILAETQGGRIFNYGTYIMMDRNLGAEITGYVSSLTDAPSLDIYPKYWGLFYQHGRKDPIRRVEGLLFDKDKDWAHGTLNPQNMVVNYTSMPANPWNGGMDDKSEYDPCPAGWRIAKTTAFPAFETSTRELLGTGGYRVPDSNCGVLCNGDYFPMCGQIPSSPSGFMNIANNWLGYEVRLYNSSVYDVDYAYFCFFRHSTPNPTYMSNYWTGGTRETAANIRCVKE